MLDSNNLSPDVPVKINHHSGRVMTFTHPDDVLHARDMHVDEKRAILTEWASDAHTVPNLPATRQLESGAIVPVDTVLDALKKLDEPVFGPSPSLQGGGIWSRVGVRLVQRWREHTRQHDDGGDDDPPPCPASALPPGVELALMHGLEEALRLGA